MTGRRRMPYVIHQKGGEVVRSLAFRPYEDVLCVGHSEGVRSIVIPGAGIANVDTFRANPYETKKQRRETEVRSLLEKIPWDTICLSPEDIGMQRTPDPVKVRLPTKEEKKERRPRRQVPREADWETNVQAKKLEAPTKGQSAC
eukprot:Trichotokara_eunicae@DN3871_c0_g1_i2.p1